MENKIFRQFLLSLIILLCMCPMFFSCRAKQEIKEIDKETNTIEHDTVRTEKLKVDTFWKPLYVPGPTQFIPSPCDLLCDSIGRLKPYNKTSHKNGMTSHTYTKGDSLINDCKADSLMQVNREKEILISTSEKIHNEKLKQVIIENEQNKWKAWWAETYKWGFWILICIFIISHRKTIARWIIPLINLH